MEGTFIEFSQHQTHFTGAPIQQSPLGTRQTTGLGMKFEPRLFANCFPLPCRSLRTDFNAFLGFLHNYLHRTMFHSRLNGYITIIIIRLTWRRPARSERMRHTFPVFQGNIRSIYIWSNYIGMCGCLRRDAPNGFCRKNSTTIKYSAISIVALKTLPPEIISWTSSVTFRKLQFLNNIEIGGWVGKRLSLTFIGSLAMSSDFQPSRPCPSTIFYSLGLFPRRPTRPNSLERQHDDIESKAEHT